MKALNILILLFFVMSYKLKAQNERLIPDDFVELARKIKNKEKPPTDLIEKYSGFKEEFKSDNGIPFEKYISQALFINDSILAIIITTNTAAMRIEKKIQTFSHNNRMIDFFHLSSYGERLESDIEYTTIDYSIYNDKIIEIKTEFCYVKNDSCRDENGFLMPDINPNDCQICDISYDYKLITDQGKFDIITLDYGNLDVRKYSFASIKLLKESDLIDYNNQELRLIRNEIFANKGYDFNSRDLKKYFEQFEWYKPISKDVTDKLTLIEIENIKLIKSLEE